VHTILVTPDPATLSLLQPALAARGHAVRRAGDGAAALSLQRERPGPLLIAEAELPDMAGAELCRRARGLPPGEDLVILLLTRREGHAELQDLLDAGATDLLAWPAAAAWIEARLRIAERYVELKRMQARLQLTDRLASLGALAAGLAHEINNPLAYVLANLSFASAELREQALAQAAPRLDEVQEALADATQGAQRLRDTVRDLMAFVRVDDRARTLLDLRQLLDLSISMAQTEIRHRARLVKDYGPVPPVLSSESRLGQVFLNLLINAAQAIPEGDAENHEIRVRTCRAASGAAVVEISDTGAGIPAEVLPRVFEPFFTTKPVGVGTGLGLAICHHHVVALGGEITVHSRPGAGTTFRVTLPAATPEELAAAQGTSGPQPVVSPGRVRLLVVDDDPLFARALQRTLDREHDLVVVTTGKEALALLQGGHRYDAILCDLMMPVMTGMDLHDAITALAPEQARRMILLTGGAFTSRARAFLEQTQLPWLRKPLEASGLWQALQQVQKG
jgi:signal transduction histidine kinase